LAVTAINDFLTALIQLEAAAFWSSVHQNRRWPRTVSGGFYFGGLD